MKRLFIDIPHIEPKLLIECKKDIVLEYLSKVFAPYISCEPQKETRYRRVLFYENVAGNTVVEVEGFSPQICLNEIRCIERILLFNSVAEENYIMLHGGSVTRNDSAIIFLGNSNAGKSTLVAHLCMNEFEYISDDRLIINSQLKTVVPFAKAISLRKPAEDILRNKYGHSFCMSQFQYKKIYKNFYEPQKVRNSDANISRIFILARKEGTKLRIEPISIKDKLSELMKYSMSVNNGQKLKDFVSLGQLQIEKIYYDDLNEMADYLKSIT